MNSVGIEQRTDGFDVAGELDVGTVPGLIQQTLALFRKESGVMTIDLQKVTRADSSGIAILIEWMRAARDSNREIVFRNVPVQLLAIAKVSGLDQILPIQN